MSFQIYCLGACLVPWSGHWREAWPQMAWEQHTEMLFISKYNSRLKCLLPSPGSLYMPYLIKSAQDQRARAPSLLFYGAMGVLNPGHPSHLLGSHWAPWKAQNPGKCPREANSRDHTIRLANASYCDKWTSKCLRPNTTDTYLAHCVKSQMGVPACQEAFSGSFWYSKFLQLMAVPTSQPPHFLL